MLIQSGVKRKKFLGRIRRIKAPNFHETFGTTETLPADFNLNPGLHPSFNQNVPNTVFSTPAQPEGCTGMGTATVAESVYKILINPYFPYQQTCILEGVQIGNGCEIPYALEEPVSVGLLTLGETTITQAGARKMPPWWEVTALNGSLFQGIVSALSMGAVSVAYTGLWFESYDTPIGGIVPHGTGPTSNHEWVFSGLLRIGNTPYLIAEPFLGENWGGEPNVGLKGGFCLFSEAEINYNAQQASGQAFTPKESPSAALPAPITTESIWDMILNVLKELTAAFQPTATMPSVEPLDTSTQTTPTQTNTDPLGYPDMIVKWSEAITRGEGADPASNNPGNLKYSTLTASWGATKGRAASDGGFLCQFSTPAAGQNALCNFLILGAQDELVAFHQARTLQEFTVVYAGNPPQGYIDGIINFMGVPGQTNVATFL